MDDEIIPTTDEVMLVLRKVAAMRAGLEPREQVLLDQLTRRAIAGPADPEVAGFGLDDWLRRALDQILAALAQPYENADDAELIAAATAWGLA
jgi:hypothetical protein